MPAARMSLIDRVPWYLTLFPVSSSHGLTMARKDSCSASVQVPMMVTVFASVVVEVPQAAITRVMTTSGKVQRIRRAM